MLVKRKIKESIQIRNIGRVGINLDKMAKKSFPDKVRCEGRPEVGKSGSYVGRENGKSKDHSISELLKKQQMSQSS